MGLLYLNYEFKSPKYKKLWENELENTISNMQKYYKNRMSLNVILSILKKVFHITPITLKTDLSENRRYLRTLAIYFLLEYSFEEKEKIVHEFQITPNELVQFKNINIDFTNDINAFFEYFKNDYLIERKSNLAFQEEISLNLTDEVLDKILST
jgi:hypothetical protein